jgi:hypothetical protein
MKLRRETPCSFIDYPRHERDGKKEDKDAAFQFYRKNNNSQG